jgi:hypothetical protein
VDYCYLARDGLQVDLNIYIWGNEVWHLFLPDHRGSARGLLRILLKIEEKNQLKKRLPAGAD